MKKLGKRILPLGMIAVLIALDQMIKAWAEKALIGRSIVVIPGLFNLTYVENPGAAGGILKDYTQQLAVVSLIVLLVLLGALLSGKIKHNILIWSFSLILAGGFGNFIDRVTRKFVIDYLDFSAIFGFPVFNLADCCVVIGTGIIIFYLLVLEKKESENIAGPPVKDAAHEED